jgi:hypothetical protein
MSDQSKSLPNVSRPSDIVVARTGIHWIPLFLYFYKYFFRIWKLQSIRLL